MQPNNDMMTMVEDFDFFLFLNFCQMHTIPAIAAFYKDQID